MQKKKKKHRIDCPIFVDMTTKCMVVQSNRTQSCWVNRYLLLKVDHNLIEQNNIYVINFYNIDHRYGSSHNIHNNYNLIALGFEG